MTRKEARLEFSAQISNLRASIKPVHTAFDTDQITFIFVVGFNITHYFALDSFLGPTFE